MKKPLVKIVFLFRGVLFKINRLCKIWKLKRKKKYEGEISENIAQLFEIKVGEDDEPNCFHVCILGQKYNLKTVNWSEDAASSYVYNKVRFDKLHYEHSFGKGIDVKNPWELSRFQFFHHFVLKYLKTNDSQYYEDFKNLVYDWCVNNPFLYGINWACTMEVSIRAINWIFGCSLFGKLFFEDEKFKVFLRNRLIDHATYIYNFPERVLNGMPNNHLIVDFCGLFVISMFVISSEANQWKNKAILGLEDCMEKQILSDGCDFECSIPYHRLALEAFIVPAFIDSDRKFFSKEYYSTLLKMLYFVKCYTDKNGNAPQLGDNDSGIILPFNKKNSLNHLYLLLLGEYLFKYPFLSDKDKSNAVSYIYPKKPQKPYENNIIYEPNTLKHFFAFSKGGYYILKNDLFDAVISVLPFDAKWHGHYGIGNFTLSCMGRPVIVDPGTGCYTANLDIRTRLKRVSSHNVYFTEEDMNLQLSYFDFPVSNYSSEIKETGDNCVVFLIRYKSQDAYIRKVYLDDDKFVVEDKFISNHNIFKGGINFMDQIYIKEGKIYSSNVCVELINVENTVVKAYDYSPIYGKIEKKTRVEFTPCAYVKIVIHVWNK